jgi:hypothetical protein
LQKSQILIGKKKNARGEIANTRAQALVEQLTKRISNLTNEYNMSFNALKQLGVKSRALKPLEQLSTKDFTGLMSLLSGDRELGQGNFRLPWFWGVKDNGEEMVPVVRSEEDLDCKSFNITNISIYSAES